MLVRISGISPRKLTPLVHASFRRRSQREASNFSIWPASPRTPDTESDDEDGDKGSKKKRKKDKKKSSSSRKDKDKHRSSKSRSSRKRSSKYSDDSESDSESDSSSSDSDRDRRRSKKRSKKSRSSKRSKRHAGSDDDGDGDASDGGRRRKSGSKGKSSRKDRDRSGSPVDRVHNEQEDEWAEKPARGSSGAPGDARLSVAAAPADRAGSTSAGAMTIKGKGKAELDTHASDSDDDDDDDVGPKPLTESGTAANPRDFGRALLRGEGEAMANFVAEGQRIPRRGEIGLESEAIEAFEKAGYVMSGSRHRRMNAVRVRKENQVISAEEKRGILKLQKDEKDRKEGLIVGSFKELVEQRLAEEQRAAARRQRQQ